MAFEFPRIRSGRRTRVSRWVELVEKEVQLAPDGAAETFHFVTQKAYVGVFGQTVDGRIPIVRQYRPCVEKYTWEFPAGTLEDGESPEEAARRELLEETGTVATDLLYLGNFYPDTGRLQVDSHAFYGKIVEVENAASGAGLSLRFVDHRELKEMIVSGAFRHQLHLGIYAAIIARGIDLAE